MKRYFLLMAAVLSVLFSVSACGVKTASSASSETESSTYEKMENDSTLDFRNREVSEAAAPFETVSEAGTASESLFAADQEMDGSQADEGESISDFANRIKDAVADSDLEGLAGLCGYPLYVSDASGEGREIESRDEFLALGPDAVFTDGMKKAIAAVDESELEEYGAGVMMGENGTIIFNNIDGQMVITAINLGE